MILLRANQELKQTFDRLIKTMKVPVQWSGIFAVIDNYVILQGEVRSLFFHFDSRKVVTNLIDIPVKEENVEDTANNIHVRNAINMILYAFGKWDRINGLKVEKNYAQLNKLFKDILREIQVEPAYNQEHFWFYKDGIRVTYEDVIQAALEYEEEKQQTDGKGNGLWHNLVWKCKKTEFVYVETDLKERLKGRLGSNFYRVGYLCPSCRKKLHMVVYPLGREFQIETEEGAVLIARAAACDNCNCFYTPRPERLFSEGDVYTMEFGEDRDAYEDYLELLGKKGDRVSNHRFNEYVDKNKRGQMRNEEVDEMPLEEFCANLDAYSPEEIERMQERMEEGFYPDTKIIRLERKIKEYSKNQEKRNPAATKSSGTKMNPNDSGKQTEAKEKEKGLLKAVNARKMEQESTGNEKFAVSENSLPHPLGKNKTEQGTTADREKGRAEPEKSTAETEKSTKDKSERDIVSQKYEAKIAVCERFSERQLKELREQLRHETKLLPNEKQNYLEQVEQRLQKGRVEQLSKKVDACEGKPYIVMKKVRDEIETEEIRPGAKQPLLDRLRSLMKMQGEKEVRQVMEKIPPNLNRAGYRQLLDKLKGYEEVSLTPYEETLHDRREQAERREVEELVKRARKISKEDCRDLIKRLEEGDFLPELILPYKEKLNEKIKKIEQEELTEICPNPFELTFEEGMEAYTKIAEGDFLPELKEDALKALTKRLSKIKTDECELLVKKLQESLQEADIAENERHHFYPAKRVLSGEALPEETEVADFAMASYAAGKGLFEYPILVVDTTRNQTGKEGMILTPDHLYYSTLLKAYGIAIPSVERITASTGLLNRGLYVHEKNGTKTKIPYAVSVKELQNYADTLDAFVKYLQEKPESRKVNYLAEKQHLKICCFRCGYIYKGGTICPKCGFQNND